MLIDDVREQLDSLLSIQSLIREDMDIIDNLLLERINIGWVLQQILNNKE